MGRRAWLAVAGVAIVIFVVGAVVLTLPPGRGTWTTEPSALDAGMQDVAQRLCLEPILADSDGSLEDVEPIQDQRGADGAGFAWIGPQQLAHCVVIGNGDGTYRPATSVLTSEDPGTTGELDLGIRFVGPPTIAIGTLGPGSEGVRLRLADGTDVLATTNDGYWLAWWPGDLAIEHLYGLDTAGAIVDEREATELH